MSQLLTRYGLLKGVENPQFYPDGNLKQVTLNKPNRIETPYGIFAPQFSDDGMRRKRVKPVTFHNNGLLKSLPLQEQVNVKTIIGYIPAELVTWYDNGEINRIFPLNGSLTGFWTEEDEYDMAPIIDLGLSYGKFKNKFVSIRFFDTKQLKNFTIWPKDTITVQTPVGLIEARTGISFFPEGQLEGIEPKKAVIVDTPIGKITAYDNSAVGIHSDSLSLRFDHAGQVKGLTTISNRISVIDESGIEHHYKPKLKDNLFILNGKVLVPLTINFKGNQVSLGDGLEDCYDITTCSFQIYQINSSELMTCNSMCESCSTCSHL